MTDFALSTENREFGRARAFYYRLSSRGRLRPRDLFSSAVRTLFHDEECSGRSEEQIPRFARDDKMETVAMTKWKSS